MSHGTAPARPPDACTQRVAKWGWSAKAGQVDLRLQFDQPALTRATNRERVPLLPVPPNVDLDALSSPRATRASRYRSFDGHILHPTRLKSCLGLLLGAT